MSDEDLIMLTQTHGADTVAGELARELFATRVIARTTVHLNLPLISDEACMAIVQISVDELRQGNGLEDRLATPPSAPAGGVC